MEHDPVRAAELKQAKHQSKIELKRLQAHLEAGKKHQDAILDDAIRAAAASVDHAKAKHRAELEFFNDQWIGLKQVSEELFALTKVEIHRKSVSREVAARAREKGRELTRVLKADTKQQPAKNTSEAASQPAVKEAVFQPAASPSVADAGSGAGSVATATTNAAVAGSDAVTSTAAASPSVADAGSGAGSIATATINAAVAGSDAATSTAAASPPVAGAGSRAGSIATAATNAAVAGSGAGSVATATTNAAVAGSIAVTSTAAASPLVADAGSGAGSGATAATNAAVAGSDATTSTAAASPPVAGAGSGAGSIATATTNAADAGSGAGSVATATTNAADAGSGAGSIATATTNAAVAGSDAVTSTAAASPSVADAGSGAGSIATATTNAADAGSGAGSVATATTNAADAGSGAGSIATATTNAAVAGSGAGSVATATTNAADAGSGAGSVATATTNAADAGSGAGSVATATTNAAVAGSGAGSVATATTNAAVAGSDAITSTAAASPSAADAGSGAGSIATATTNAADAGSGAGSIATATTNAADAGSGAGSIATATTNAADAGSGAGSVATATTNAAVAGSGAGSVATATTNAADAGSGAGSVATATTNAAVAGSGAGPVATATTNAAVAGSGAGSVDAATTNAAVAGSGAGSVATATTNAAVAGSGAGSIATATTNAAVAGSDATPEAASQPAVPEAVFQPAKDIKAVATSPLAHDHDTEKIKSTRTSTTTTSDACSDHNESVLMITPAGEADDERLDSNSDSDEESSTGQASTPNHLDSDDSVEEDRVFGQKADDERLDSNSDSDEESSTGQASTPNHLDSDDSVEEDRVFGQPQPSKKDAAPAETNNNDLDDTKTRMRAAKYSIVTSLELWSATGGWKKIHIFRKNTGTKGQTKPIVVVFDNSTEMDNYTDFTYTNKVLRQCNVIVKIRPLQSPLEATADDTAVPAGAGHKPYIEQCSSDDGCSANATPQSTAKELRYRHRQKTESAIQELQVKMATTINRKARQSIEKEIEAMRAQLSKCVDQNISQFDKERKERRINRKTKARPKSAKGGAEKFEEEDYYPRPDLDVLEPDGATWRNAALYERKDNSNVVLWFGGEEYEGLGKPYKWVNAELRDGDNDVVTTRPVQPGKRRRQSQRPFNQKKHTRSRRYPGNRNTLRQQKPSSTTTAAVQQQQPLKPSSTTTAAVQQQQPFSTPEAAPQPAKDTIAATTAADADAAATGNDLCVKYLTQEVDKHQDSSHLGPEVVRRKYRRLVSAREVKELMQHKKIFYFDKMRSANYDAESTDNNFNYDTSHGRLKFVHNMHIAYRYQLTKKLGFGTFGDVYQAWDHLRLEYVAIKIIANTKSSTRLAEKELDILTMFQDTPQFIHMKECFVFRDHHCFTFPLGKRSLIEALKDSEDGRFSCDKIFKSCKPIAEALVIMQAAHVIHTDIKLDNCMIMKDDYATNVLIDFGAATKQVLGTRKITTRNYRGPEVFLEGVWGEAVDVWSFGCLLAEVFTGDILFCGKNDHEFLLLQERLCGKIPQDMLDEGKRSSNFVDGMGNMRNTKDNFKSSSRFRRFRTLEQALTRHKKIWKKQCCFLSEGSCMLCKDGQLIDLVRQCLQMCPTDRILPRDILAHPFFDGWIDYIMMEGVFEVPKNMFAGNTRLRNVCLPESVRIIKPYAFDGCTNLLEVNLPDKLVEVGKAAFMNCFRLRSVSFPASMLNIEEYAFFNCESLDTLHLNDGLEHIQRHAFRGCKKVEELIIPDSVTIIGSFAFSGLRIHAVVLPNHLVWLKRDVVETTGTGTRTVRANRAFDYCENLANVLAPDDLVNGTFADASKAFDPWTDGSKGGDLTVKEIFRGCHTSLKLTPYSKVKLPRRRYWHKTMHWWCTDATHERIKTVLAAAVRIERLHNALRSWQPPRRPPALPHLPSEMWMHILGFLPH